MALNTFRLSLIGISAADIRNFMVYLHEKVFLGREAIDVSISRYRDIHVFANMFMKKKLDLFLHELSEGRDLVDVLRREGFISSMDHHLLKSAQSFGAGLNVIVRPDSQHIDLVVPSIKGMFYWSTIPSTFIPMTGELGKGVEGMIQSIGKMRSGDENAIVALPFFFKDPFASIVGWGSLAIMIAFPLGLALWHRIHLASYLKFDRLKEIEYGISLFTPLMQMAQNGLTLHEGFEYMVSNVSHPTLSKMLREVSWHYDQGNSNMALIFQRYGFGREITDIIDEIEKSGVSPAKALARGVESLELRRERVRKDYSNLLSAVPKWISIAVLLMVATLGSMSYFDAFLGTSIKH